MDGPEDVQMAEAPSSQSSSLSPPPSSLPDTFEYHWEEEVVTTASENIGQSTSHKVPDTDISLESITLATPISAATPISEEGEDDEMAMTRAQRAAEEAKKNGPAQVPPIPSLVTKVEKSTTTKRRRPNGTSTKTQGGEEESGDEAAGKKLTKTTATKKSPPKKTPPKKVATEPDVNGGDSSDKNKKKGPVRESPTNKPTAEPPTKQKSSPAKGVRASGRNNKGKKPETADVPKTTPPVIKKKTTKKTGWEPEKVLTSSRSRLTDLLGNQLRNMLCTSEAWDVLPIQDKADIIALMPQTIPVVPRTATSDSRPDVTFLANSDNFNFDCGQYVDHLRNGQHERRWILEAMDAHDQHTNGDFDSLIQAKFTHDWEEEWPTESKDGEDQEGEDGEGGEEVENGDGGQEGEQSDTNA